MVSMLGKSVHSQSRPKGDLVAKEDYRETCKNLLTLGNERLLIGYSGGMVTSPRGIQILETESFALVDELEGVGPHAMLNKNGEKLLASGQLFHGYQSETSLVDITSMEKVATWPLRPPFALLPDGRFVATTPAHNPMRQDGTIELYTSPKLLEAYRQFEPDISQKDTLLVVDPITNAAERLLEGKVPSLDEWKEPKHLALSEDGLWLYCATTTAVFKIDVVNRTVVWTRILGRNDQQDVYSIYAMSLNPDSQMIAVGGISSVRNSERNMVVLRASDGESVLELPLSSRLALSGLKNAGNTSIHALKWHPAGWIAAATSSGVVAHIAPDGKFRAYKGASKGIYGLTFIRKGTLLVVGGQEKQLRVWPLLEDECDT